MSFTHEDLPDLTGKNVVVTGANSGVGYRAAKALAEHGATVTLACRNLEAATEADHKIDGPTRVERLDLASLQSVRDFASRLEGPLDLLVNNAGVMTPPRYRETEDGFELQLGTNHFAHFALTALLMPQLQEAGGRVVSISSVVHHQGDPSVLEGNPREGYRPQQAYANSKLANLLFALELHRRLTATGSAVTSTAAHPGVSATGLIGSRDGLGSMPVVRLVAPVVTPLVLQSATAGANPTLYAATQAEPGSYTGPQWLSEWRGPVGPAKLSRFARDEGLAAKMWDISAEKTGVPFEVA